MNWDRINPPRTQDYMGYTIEPEPAQPFICCCEFPVPAHDYPKICERCAKPMRFSHEERRDAGGSDDVR
jgi:hypothetical protein